MERLTEIRQRAEAATPGPWKVVDQGNTVPSLQVVNETTWENPKQIKVCSSISPKREADANFIAHSREDIPYLLSEVDRLNALHKREIIITGEYAQRVIDLTARAEAAEADLRKCAPCWLCKKKCGIFDALDQRKDGCCPNFEWRGPQAEEGDSNG